MHKRKIKFFIFSLGLMIAMLILEAKFWSLSLFLASIKFTPWFCKKRNVGRLVKQLWFLNHLLCMLLITQILRVIKDKPITMEINKGIKVAIMEDMVEKEEIQRRKGLSVLTVELFVILQTNATNCMVIH